MDCLLWINKKLWFAILNFANWLQKICYYDICYFEKTKSCLWEDKVFMLKIKSTPIEKGVCTNLEILSPAGRARPPHTFSRAAETSRACARTTSGPAALWGPASRPAGSSERPRWSCSRGTFAPTRCVWRRWTCAHGTWNRILFLSSSPSAPWQRAAWECMATRILSGTCSLRHRSSALTAHFRFAPNCLDLIRQTHCIHSRGCVMLDRTGY